MFLSNSQQEIYFTKMSNKLFNHAINTHSCLVIGLVYTPATGGEDYDGPSTTFEGRLYSSDGCDLCGVRGEGSEATQLLKQLLVENGRLCLPADLCEGAGDTEGERAIRGH